MMKRWWNHSGVNHYVGSSFIPPHTHTNHVLFIQGWHYELDSLDPLAKTEGLCYNLSRKEDGPAFLSFGVGTVTHIPKLTMEGGYLIIWWKGPPKRLNIKSPSKRVGKNDEKCLPVKKDAKGNLSLIDVFRIPNDVSCHNRNTAVGVAVQVAS